MRRIILDEPKECGLSVSEQLQMNGVRIGDSNFKEAYANVFQLFSRYASAYYEVVAQRECLTDDDRKCGLCGKTELGTYFTVERVCTKPLVTCHTEVFDFDFELQWPCRIPLGSSCVKLLGIPMILPKMFNSMFRGHPNFQLTPGGLILIGTVVRNYRKWAYPRLAIPHSVFTRFPLDVMKEFNLSIYRVNNPIYPDECTQKGIQRSIKARSEYSKYGLRSDVTWCHSEDAGWWRTDMVYDDLVTIVPVTKAEQIYNRYFTKTR